MTDNKVAQPYVAVITINYNHSKETIDCLRSILDSSYDYYHIFLVDNGSEVKDYLKLKSAIAGFEKVSLLRMEYNKGYVGGVNFGLRNASQSDPEYYLIMNNDTIIDKDAMEELIKSAEKYNGNAIVSGKSYHMDDPQCLRYIGQKCVNHKQLKYKPYVKAQKEYDSGQFDREIEMDMIDDIFWVLSKKIFKSVGYYSTYFFLYGEQNDYALRALKKGYKLIYTPWAKIFHYSHLTTGSGNRKALNILYLQTYAGILLQYLHTSSYQFTRYYISVTAKSWIQFIFHKLRLIDYPKSIAKVYATYYFTLWLFHQEENTGFIPPAVLKYKQ